MAEYHELPPRMLALLWVIKGELESDPNYLTAPECPYGPELVDLLSGLAPQKVVQAPVVAPPKADKADKWDTLEEETADLFKELKNYVVKLNEEDTAEHMAYFRTATALTEKLISLRERAYGTRQVQEFIRSVLGVFDEELAPDVRTRVMDRLRSFKND